MDFPWKENPVCSCAACAPHDDDIDKKGFVRSSSRSYDPCGHEGIWESADRGRKFTAGGGPAKVQACEQSRGQLDADAMANAGPGLGGAFVPFLQKPAGAAELVHELVRRPTVNLI